MKTKITLLLLLLTNIFFGQALDTSFNISGYNSVSLANFAEFSKGMHQQSNGKYIVTSNAGQGSINYDYYASRFNSDGTLDTSFGTNGTTMVNFGTTYDEFQSSVLQVDDKIILVGSAKIGNDIGFAICRLTTDGQLDNSFNSNGKVFLPLQSNSYAYKVKIDSNNKIVITGQTFDGTNNIAVLVRLNPDGSNDATFGTNGIVYASNVSGEFRSFEFDAKNAIIVPFGTASSFATNPPTPQKVWVRKYTNTGLIDTSFGINGNYQFNFVEGQSPVNTAIYKQSNGKLIILGTDVVNYNPYTPRIYLTRLNENGTLDTSFNTIGYKFVDNITQFALKIDNSNTILGCGLRYVITPGVGATTSQVMMLFDANGTINNSFGTNGTYVETISNMYYGYDINIDSNNKIIAPINIGNTAGMARYNIPLLYNQDFNQKQNFTIFPNPSIGTFNIQVSDEMLGAKATIYSVLGNKMSSFEVSNEMVNQNLCSGMYVLELENNGIKTSKKLIIK